KYSELSKDLFSEGLKLLPEAHSLLKDGTTVNLTSREFTIFKHLYDSKATVSRDEIIKQFTSDEEMTLRNIDVHIFALRKKLKKVGIAIATVWGAGYKLDQEA
ncbi:MAG: winged helix-turn-helix domain-containing protein, partial [Proteobacteria bacterium]|nr:winged helix-turn-helix domain-containing protein [Pseudomonadota bacterium]